MNWLFNCFEFARIECNKVLYENYKDAKPIFGVSVDKLMIKTLDKIEINPDDKEIYIRFNGNCVEKFNKYNIGYLFDNCDLNYHFIRAYLYFSIPTPKIIYQLLKYFKITLGKDLSKLICSRILKNMLEEIYQKRCKHFEKITDEYKKCYNKDHILYGNGYTSLELESAKEKLLNSLFSNFDASKYF